MKNKSIIFIGQTVNHNTLYENFLVFLQKTFNEITFISRDQIVKEINREVILKTKLIIDNSIISKVIKQNLSIINSHDIFICDEYNSAYIYLFKTKFLNKKKIIILHNINRWTQYNKNIFSKNFIDWFFSKRLYSQFNAVITIGPNIKKYYQSLNDKKKSFFFPFDEYNENIEINQVLDNERISIVIPGTISSHRRDYVDLLKTLQKYYSSNKDSKIIFKLLGKINKEKEHQILKLIESINYKYGEKIYYWNKFIPISEFEQEIMNSDFVFSNIIMKTAVRGINEFYGISKESGISFITYKFAKPTIVPFQQKILEGFDSQLVKFNDYNEVFYVLQKIDNNQINIKQLKLNALENRKKFNKLINIEKQELLNYLIK